MRKITRRLAVLTSAAALAGFGLAAAGGSGVALAGQNGTTLSETVSASAHLTKTFNWGISKSVDRPTLNLFQGDSDSANYTVSLTKDAGTVQSSIDGQVCITNGGDVDTQGLLSTINVTMPPSTTVVASEPLDVSPMPVIGAGGTYCYPYSIDVPNPVSGASYKVTADTAILNHSGSIGDPKGPHESASLTMPNPTLVHDSVSVSDDQAGSLGTFSSGGTLPSYSHKFSCDTDMGENVNTASITYVDDQSAGPSASASVTVNCYDLAVDKTAKASFTRTWNWSVLKSADPSSLTLAQGETFPVNYKVHVDAKSADSDWKVNGDITITNPAPMAASVSVEDVLQNLPGVGVTLTDAQGNPLPAQVTVPANDKVVVKYQSDALPAGDPGTNEAKVTQSLPISGGTQVYSDTAGFKFENPTKVLNEKGSLSDTFAGANLPLLINAVDMPQDYSYTRTVGPYSAAGTYGVDNTVTVTGSDGQRDQSQAHVTVNVPSNGCTLTIGYWKNHPVQTAKYLPITLGTSGGLKSVQVTSASQASTILGFNGQASNGINKLLGQLLGAKLDIATGADSSAVAGVISAADTFLATHGSGDWSGLTKAQQQQVLSWMSQLDNYNNGLTGPGHCTQ